MDLHLKGKVVAVTGGAAGIGRAAAEEFLKEGALLAVCGRTEARLEAFAAEMKEQGFPEVYTMQADVSSAEQMNAFAAGIRKRFGRIDVWVMSFPFMVMLPLIFPASRQRFRLPTVPFTRHPRQESAASQKLWRQIWRPGASASWA